MASATPSTTSEPAEPEVVELVATALQVARVEHRSASFSWEPLGKVPVGFSASYAIELQQLDGDSNITTNWVSVYKGDALSCKVDELKSGRRYAVRLVASVETCSEETSGPVEERVEVRVHNAEHVFFQTPPSIPSLLQPPALAQRARNALKLKWSSPEDPGGLFELTYVLQVSPAPQGLEDQRGQMGFVEVYRGPERSYKVVKLQPGVRYTSRVQAINPLGEGLFSLCSAYTTQATVPAAPEPPVVQTASSSTMELAWSAPADNGSPITGYCLERDEGGTGDFTLVYAGPNTNCTVKGLKPGQAYRFRLRADNDEGKSLWSSSVALSTGAAPPDSPVALQVVTAGRTSATMAWRTPDDDGGSKVVAFGVELQAKSKAATACMGTEWLKIFEGEAHACTINSLRPGCAYRVRVRARNAVGWGQWALPVDLTTAADAPEVPQSLQPASCTPTTIVITWAPPRHDGGSKVHTYRMEMASADCVCGRCPHAAAPAAAAAGGAPHLPPGLHQAGAAGAAALRPTLCPGHTPLAVYAAEAVGAELRHLQPGCWYIFRVQAVNQQGSSSWTDWVAGATCADVPTAPGPPLVAGVAPTALMLSWQVPLAQGAPVTHYSVEAAALPPVPGAMLGSPGGAGVLPDVRAAAALAWKLAYRGPHPGCEVRGLEPYSAYAFRVCAHNDVGAGGWSPAVAAITGHAAPSAPQALSAQAASSAKIVLCWAPPERDYGAPVVAYTVEMAPATTARAGGGGAGREAAGAGGGGGRGAGGAAAPAWSHVFTGPACACSAEGLAPGRAYQFRVRAANLCGAGPFTAPVATVTQPAPPSAPGKPVVSNRTSSGFRVRWDEPEHTYGSHVAAYVLQAAPAGGAGEEWAEVYRGPEASARLSGLAPACKYLLRAAAVNAAGQGPWGEPESAITQLLPPLPPCELAVAEGPALAEPAGAEGAGEAPAAPPQEGAWVCLSWQEPEADATHAPAMGYEVVATPRPGSEASPVKLNITGRRGEARLEGLAPGCSYSVRVRSVGVDGTGHSGWSEEAAVQTPALPESEEAAAGGGGALAVSGVTQRKGGKKAGKKGGAAGAGAGADRMLANGGAPSVSSDDAVSVSREVLPAGAGGRGKGGKAAGRVAAAANTVAAKKMRTRGFVEKLVDEKLPRGLASCLEMLLVACFTADWRRCMARHVWWYVKVLVIMFAVFGLALMGWHLYVTDMAASRPLP
ncbi:hypothetical protein HYH02_012072 [Chlamydomonas schloesseri]|uniref:Fibronectin type-III domain-containing protein n=1 Tax=Chlamydomonas schloesseri TaxID=2026947 RepID=A0A835SX13_9CHLO|nr:hypothetical protein HYH02_012072 [Chlamydomonas schloesseri]|eukprot:KAG2434872.1 hypothetical protein HYH02_012072 [Chlamydomonas schloesseri]